MTIEELLVEANKVGLREEVLIEAASIRRHKEYITHEEIYEQAFERVKQRTQ